MDDATRAYARRVAAELPPPDEAQIALLTRLISRVGDEDSEVDAA